MDERRLFERKPTSIKVEMTHPALGGITGFARDISDGGASVLIDNQPLPPVGTVLCVKFKRIAGPINEEPVFMRVMYHHRNVIGLMFMPARQQETPL